MLPSNIIKLNGLFSQSPRSLPISRSKEHVPSPQLCQSLTERIAFKLARRSNRLVRRRGINNGFDSNLVTCYTPAASCCCCRLKLSILLKSRTYRPAAYECISIHTGLFVPLLNNNNWNKKHSVWLI